MSNANIGSPSRQSAFSIWHFTGCQLAFLVLTIVFLAAHVPFLPASLEDLDSINFAMGVRHFDVAHHQPHPPGYPVFIVAAKIARVAIGPDEIALSLVSILAGALAIFALFALFRAIGADPRSERRAAVATLLTVTAPLYWFTAIRPLRLSASPTNAKSI